MDNIGYARVSTFEQHLDLQIAALRAAGCTAIFTDHGISGTKFERPGLSEALEAVAGGGMLVVWRLDRLGRSLLDLINIVNDLGERGVEFHSLTESIDTSSSGGRLTFHIMAAMAEFERAIISERTRAGMDAARAKGRRIGRKPALSAAQKIEARAALERHGGVPDDIAAGFGIHPRTLLRLLREQERSPAVF